MSIALWISAGVCGVIAGVLACLSAFGNLVTRVERFASDRLDSLSAAWLRQVPALIWPLIPMTAADRRFREAFDALTLTQVLREGFPSIARSPVKLVRNPRKLPDEAVREVVCGLSAGFLLTSLLSLAPFIMLTRLLNLWILAAFTATIVVFASAFVAIGVARRIWLATAWPAKMLLVPFSVLVLAIYGVSGATLIVPFSAPTAVWAAVFLAARVCIISVGKLVTILHSFGGSFVAFSVGVFTVAAASLSLAALLTEG
jgi:hypothetical protein